MRIATYPHLQNVNERNMRLQVEFAEKNRQLSSGVKSENWAGIADDAELALNIQSDINRYETFVTNLQESQTEIEIMYNILDNMLQKTDEMMSALSAAISGGQLTDAELAVTTDVILDDLVGSLNEQYAGLFLFGGANTTNAPVDLTDPDYPTPFNVGDPADTEYYQGTQDLKRVKADDNYEITYGIVADDPAFEQLLRGMQILQNAPANDAARDEAFDLLIAASDGMKSIFHELSVKGTSVADHIAEHQTVLTQLDNAYTTIVSTDIATVSTEVATIETQLQAAYSSTSTILNLSILDYLR